MNEEGHTVEVGTFTIGEVIPIRGVWFEVADARPGGQEFTIRAVGVTAGWAKKQARTMRSRLGKHYRAQSARQRRDNEARIAKARREAIAEERAVRRWLVAEAKYNRQLLLAELS